MRNQPSIEIFNSHRDALFGIAYRMTGTRADADDVVQDAWLRWEHHAGNVQHPTSWLCQTTTRLAIDASRRAYRRRETYVGPWLPEPLYEQTGDALRLFVSTPDPEQNAIMAESIRLGFLRCLDLLTPSERAAYLMRRVYGLEYAELAEILQRSEAAVRKLVSRAGQKLDTKQAGSSARPVELEVVSQFLSALGEDDVEAMSHVLLQDVSATTDSDGKRTAARRPIVGQGRVIAFLRGLAEKQKNGWSVEFVASNGDIALKVLTGGALQSVIVPVVSAGAIREFLIYRNPDKFPR